MLMHGRLILTQHGFLLDEVKSLLQKALRRKDLDLIARSAKELSGKSFKDLSPSKAARDQLQWKALVNYLFEDHCLSDVKVLQKFYKCYQKKDKLRAVELLSECYTCRVAACLPVVALNDEYLPEKVWKKEFVCERGEWTGVVVSGQTNLRFDQILFHLKDAWEKKDVSALITCMKLCSMVIDVDKGHPREGSLKCLLSPVKKPNIGHVVTSFLYKNTQDAYWKEYIRSCFDLLDIPDVCVRLVLFTIVVHVQFKDYVKNVDVSKLGKIDWENVEKLQSMPSWAVDKHTFRGKFGKGTRHLLKKKDNQLTEEEKQEFHGERPKVGIQNFFEEGCICSKESLEECGNPYWENTKNIYYEKPPKLQKTVHMTGVYYNELKKRSPFLFKKTCVSKSEKQSGPDTSDRKRKSDKKESVDDDVAPLIKKQKLNRKETKKTENETDEIVQVRGPLLQLPTGGFKVYTWVDLATQKVWKGPYRQAKYNLTLFFHRGLQEVLKDIHTLVIEPKDPYLVFPLLQGKGASLNVTKMDIYDCIAKKNVQQQEFIQRGDLEIVQLHRLDVDQVKRLPYTIWLHFIYRFLFNIGDSGLYNAITDKELSFIFGIDMEENRASVKGYGLLDLMFTKLPAKAYQSEIKKVLPTHKANLKQALELIGEGHLNQLQTLAKEYQVPFDSDTFRNKKKQAMSACK